MIRKLVVALVVAVMSVIGLAAPPVFAGSWGPAFFTPQQSEATVLASDGSGKWIAKGCTYTLSNPGGGVTKRATFYCTQMRPDGRAAGDFYASASSVTVRITCLVSGGGSGVWYQSAMGWSHGMGTPMPSSLDVDFLQSCSGNSFGVTAQVAWRVWAP